MTPPLLRTGLILVIAAVAVFVLETARIGVVFDRWSVGPTPVTTLAKPGANGPHIVVAHGFAGSREMMQGYGLTLAQAGYRVHMFDFEGHGAHPLPMSGDVTRIEGTTQRLMDQTLDVIAHVGDDTSPVGLLGHSMATDVLVRVAEISDQTGPLVLLSAFSRAITPTHPQDMLLISGQWEPPLRAFAVEALQMVSPDAQEGMVVEDAGTIRSATIAPFTEHVAILHSRAGRADAVAWFNRAYDREDTASIPPIGWAFLALMAAITMLTAPLARACLVGRDLPSKPILSTAGFAAICTVPMLATPIIAAPLEIHFLPVLVADYLAVHLGIYGLVSLITLRVVGGRIGWGHVHLWGLCALIFWGLLVFGAALDRYGANFIPVVERLPIILALSAGALPFMLADSMVSWKQPLWRRVLLRLAFLTSLGLAVVIDTEGLLFLIMIAPVIVLFFLVHGTMGRAVGKQVGPLTAGLAMGLILAWALGVSFPMFSA